MYFGVYSLISRRNLCFKSDSFLTTEADLHCTKVNSRAQSKCPEAGACSRVFSRRQGGTSLVAQGLRICLAMQGTRVRSLVWEDPTCRGATKPVRHNYWACALEPTSHNYWAHVPQLLKSPCSTTREATAMRSPRTAMKSSPRSPQLEKACAQQWRPSAAKNK